MVRREERCCAFLAFALAEGEDEVRLTITAPEQARKLADELFEQFVPASGARGGDDSGSRWRTARPKSAGLRLSSGG